MKTAIFIALALVLAAGNAYPAGKHECGFCHFSEGKAAKGLKAPLSALCLECHPERTNQSEHKVDIVPSMTVAGLPLDREGKMTCITCHDPHGKEGSPMLLRVTPSELCLKCHFK